MDGHLSPARARAPADDEHVREVVHVVVHPPPGGDGAVGAADLLVVLLVRAVADGGVDEEAVVLVKDALRLFLGVRIQLRMQSIHTHKSLNF